MKPPLSIAILPFSTLSRETDLAYFADGLAEEIINALTRIPGLRVIARTSSFAYRDRAMDVRTIGQQLGVRTLLEGSIRGDRERVRITLQLVATRDGFHFWSETFDRSLDDIFALEDELSLRVADQLRAHGRHFELADQLLPARDIPSNVHHTYLRGRYLVQRYNKPEVLAGVDLLRALTEQYPYYERPWLTLCHAYSYLGAMGVVPRQESFARARAALERAVALQPHSVEARIRLAGVAFWEQWDLPETFRQLHGALELQSGNAEALLWLGVAHAAQRNFPQALSYLDRAKTLDPLSVLIHNFAGSIHYFREDYAAAEAALLRSLELDADYLMSHVQLGATYLMTGRLAEGLRTFEQLPAAGDADYSRAGGIALAKGMLGEEATARRGLATLEQASNSAGDDRALFFRILIHTVLEEYEEAIRLLEVGVQRKVSMLVTIGVEPFFRPLHRFERFRALVDRVIAPGRIAQPATAIVDEPPGGPTAADRRTFDRVNAYVRREQPYLEPDLNLRELARRVHLHSNELSRLINEVGKRNFADYINGYRVAAFQDRALAGAAREKTILALAFECGFNSKTVFNTYFKRSTGMTPSAYLRSRQAF